MTKELEQKLQEKYPHIFEDLYGDKRQTCMVWGIETSDGWYWLIENLCATIQGYIDNNKHLNIQQVKAIQIKEKFGGLRFYYNGGDKIIEGMVWFAENLSYEICETCGSTHNLGLTKSWIKVMCEDCAKKSDKYHDWRKYDER